MQTREYMYLPSSHRSVDEDLRSVSLGVASFLYNAFGLYIFVCFFAYELWILLFLFTNDFVDMLHSCLVCFSFHPRSPGDGSTL